MKNRRSVTFWGLAGFTAWVIFSCTRSWEVAAQRSDPKLPRASSVPLTDEERKSQDWAYLSKYRDADEALTASPNKATTRAPKVVFFGDSITEHWGQRDASGVSSTGDYLESHGYLNRGISGQTTPQMLVRFREDVINLKPRVLVLLAGTNDIAGNSGPMSLEETENNLTTMAELAKFHEITVVFCTVPPATAFWWTPKVRPAEKIAVLNAWIRSYAAARHLPFVDYYAVLSDSKGGIRTMYSEDGVHPNMEGYRVMQAVVEPVLKRTSKATD